jgi:hypothetical protein
VTRFLGGSFRGVVSRVIDHSAGLWELGDGIAVSRDGSTLFVTAGRREIVYECRVDDGSRLRVVRSCAAGQVCVAPDGFVFIADYPKHCVHVLTPDLSPHSVIGKQRLTSAAGVCASNDVVVVADDASRRCVKVFRRSDGSLLSRFGPRGSGDGELMEPRRLCLVRGGSRIAVVDGENHRVSVFSVGGEFIHHVGVGVLYFPHGIACSAFDELVVSGGRNDAFLIFSDVGDVLMSFHSNHTLTDIALHDSTLFAVDPDHLACVVFE